MTTTQKLERLAHKAHTQGASWSEFWPTVADQVEEVARYSAADWHRLHRRLYFLWLLGKGDGRDKHPEPWRRDDRAHARANAPVQLGLFGAAAEEMVT